MVFLHRRNARAAAETPARNAFAGAKARKKNDPDIGKSVRPCANVRHIGLWSHSRTVI
jgi:hypothetical protein